MVLALKVPAPRPSHLSGAGSCFPSHTGNIQQAYTHSERPELDSYPAEEEVRQPLEKHAAAAQGTRSPTARQTGARLPSDGDRQAVQPRPAGRPEISHR